MNISPLKKTHTAVLVEITKLAMPHPWCEKTFYDCFKENYYAWILQLNGEVVGFVIILVQLPNCDLMNIVVHPDYQRQGYGEQLLQHAITFAKSRGAQKMLLEVRRSNLAAIQLYQQCGGSEIGVRKGYYADDNGREDAVLFELSLL